MGRGLVRIRLARFGRVNSPIYNIVVAKAFKARDTKPIEVLGTYNPVPRPLTKQQKKAHILPVKDVQLDLDKVKYWVGVGAQPSDTVTGLLKKCGILDENWGRNYQAKKPLISPRKEATE